MDTSTRVYVNVAAIVTAIVVTAAVAMPVMQISHQAFAVSNNVQINIQGEGECNNESIESTFELIIPHQNSCNVVDECSKDFYFNNCQVNKQGDNSFYNQEYTD